MYTPTWWALRWNVNLNSWSRHMPMRTSNLSVESYLQTPNAFFCFVQGVCSLKFVQFYRFMFTTFVVADSWSSSVKQWNRCTEVTTPTSSRASRMPCYPSRDRQHTLLLAQRTYDNCDVTNETETFLSFLSTGVLQSASVSITTLAWRINTGCSICTAPFCKISCSILWYFWYQDVLLFFNGEEGKGKTYTIARDEGKCFAVQTSGKEMPQFLYVMC